VYGGGQEYGLRAGTENVALDVALGTACRLASEELAPDRIRKLRDHLHDSLADALPDRVRLNGPIDARLPNTLNVSILGVAGHELLAKVPDIAASTGSACHSGDHTPSPVLSAMGLDTERALSAIRLSLGRRTTLGDVELAADQIAMAASRADRQ
jgi:cysteine desulfurase